MVLLSEFLSAGLHSTDAHYLRMIRAFRITFIRLIPLTHPDQHIVVQRDGVEGPAGNEESVSGLYFG